MEHWKLPIFEIDKGTTLFFRNESAYSKILILEKLEISGEILKKDVCNEFFVTEFLYISYYNGWRKKHLETLQNKIM